MHDFQGIIYRLEHGGGARVVRHALALLAFCALAAFYDSHFYKNFHTEEAMDSAQLAANISQGGGFSTLYIRPLSLRLLARDGRTAASAEKQTHPDLANAPAYPVLLSGLMSILPFHPDIPSTKRKNFTLYQPEIIITIFNQILYMLAVAALFQTARLWFDETTAWIAAVAFGGSEIYWKFSISGISTTLAVLWFIGLVRLLASLDAEIRAEQPRNSQLWWQAAGLGALIAAGCLIRYSLGWIMAPVLVFLVAFGGRFRWRALLAVSLVFLALTAPWLSRNYAICGNFFGLAGYAPCELTRSFPADSLLRSSNPAAGLGALGVFDFERKLIANGHEIIASKLPTLGANWIFTLFLAGILLPFNSPVLSRLRCFLLGLLPVFVIVEALGKTHLSNDSPDINSENLLVIFAPVTFIFAAHFLATLVEQRFSQSPFLRPMFIAVATITALPLLAALLAPASFPLAYPPYYPPALRAISNWIKPDEAVMTDIPWAMAWYGHRKAVGLALDSKDEFKHIYLESKDIRAVFLSAKLLDEGFRDLVETSGSWGRLAVIVCSGGAPPNDFPFQAIMQDFLPDEVLLGDTPRWTTPIPTP